MSRGDKAGTFELLARLPAQIVALGKAEYRNAKREITAKAKRAGVGLLAIIVALFFLFFALSAFVAAAIAGLNVVWPLWLSALVVGFGLILLAGAAILGGIVFIKRGIPVPGETIDRIEGDLNAFADVRFNDSAHGARRPAQDRTGPGVAAPGRAAQGGPRRPDGAHTEPAARGGARQAGPGVPGPGSSAGASESGTEKGATR